MSSLSLRSEASAAPAAPSSTAGWLGALERSSRIGTEPHRLLAHVIEEVAGRYGTNVALTDGRDSLTYDALVARMNRYAHWAHVRGFTKGDAVCLLMPNRCEYLAIWLGLSRVGVAVALLNTNLTGASLAHCIAVARPHAVIADASLAERYEAARAHLAAEPDLWVLGESSLGRSLGTAVASLPDTAPTPAELVALSDRALLIYTSGTTGLPKAANVSHHRVMTWSLWFAGLMATRPDDRIYDCLPLYHSVGGVVATGSVLSSGGTVVIRERFSASRFWDDIVAERCTLFQYIGELCRYLVGAPAHPRERAHSLRLCAGNGLRGDVWAAFQERFAVPRVLEFYAATEGTVSLYNVEGKVGAVGRVPSFMAHRFPAAIVRFDHESGAPMRNADGFCTRAARGEPGELIGRLASNPEQAAQRFEGYTSEAETDRKVLRDVFAKGDAWLRTGDLMRQDDKGFFYFVDRIGDTFRWRGENVATTEVAEVVGSAPGVIEAVIYGVAVPGTEGRAGMAALTVAPDFDRDAFHAFVAARLPAYACPVFLRLCAEIAITETFKQKKSDLVADGFDPDRTADPLYVQDAGRYRPLDPATFAAIGSGAMRV